MRTRSAIGLLVSICLFAGGCAHAQLPAPPPVACVEAVPTGQWLHVDGSTGIDPVDVPRGALGTAEGDMRPVPREMLAGARARNPWAGALIGGALGAAAGGGLMLDIVAGDYWYKYETDDSSLSPSRCRNICDTRDALQFLVPAIVIGAVVGYLVGGPRTAGVRN